MTRLWIASDLHQEFGDNIFTPRTPDADIIVVAGDCDSPLSQSIATLREWFPSQEIVYVPGNHDFWQSSALFARQTMDEILEAGHEAAKRHGVHLLTDMSKVIAGIRFLGCTLWTDYRVEGLQSIRGAMRAAEKGMNDYRMIRRPSSTKLTKPIRPIDLLQRHQASVAFLDAELGLAFDGPSVVVTHHAPHPRSLPKQFDALNVCYASDLTELMRRHAPQLWVHGHIHMPSDYMVDNTRIVANPRGYPGERANWDANVIIEV